MNSNEWDVRDEVEWWDDMLGEDEDLDGDLFSFILTKISSKPSKESKKGLMFMVKNTMTQRGRKIIEQW